MHDLGYFVEYKHAGMLEVYHSLMLQYGLKRDNFVYYGMITWTQLAALDYNQHQGRNESDEVRYKYSHSKVSANWAAKPVMEMKDFNIPPRYAQSRSPNHR